MPGAWDTSWNSDAPPTLVDEQQPETIEEPRIALPPRDTVARDVPTTSEPLLTE